MNRRPMFRPPKPEGVTIHRADGTELNAELHYTGRDADGCHTWAVAGALLKPGDRITCAVLPPRTAITAEIRHP